MAVMTNLLLLVGAGLFSRSVGSFEWFQWLKLLHFQLSEGDGPGTYPVQGNVWHLDCCNPYDLISSRGWAIFNAILGWTNNATCTPFPPYTSSGLSNSHRRHRIVLCVLLARCDIRVSIHEI